MQMSDWRYNLLAIKNIAVFLADDPVLVYSGALNILYNFIVLTTPVFICGLSSNSHST